MNSASTRPEKKDPWHQGPVSWGQFILGLITVCMTLGGFILGNETRLSKVETRQAFVFDYMVTDKSDSAAVRAKRDAQIDSIKNMVQQLSIDLARHEAAQEMLESQYDGKPRLKAPHQ